MNKNEPRQPNSGAKPSYTLMLAVLAALGLPGSAAAQTVPHQASQRQDYGTGLGQSELPKGGRFEPRLEAALQYVSNINLAEDGRNQIDTAGIELAPGFYASYSTGNVVAAIDYSLIARQWEDSDYNDVSHRLSANGDWYAVPEWISISGQASYGDSVIDPRNGLNYGGIGIFGAGNLSEYAAASISPLLNHRFNDFEVNAYYDYGRTWYLDEGKGQPTVGFNRNQDSTDQAAGARLGTANTGSRWSASVFYDWQKSEFPSALPYEFERAGLDADVQVSRTLSFIGNVGKESDLDASTQAGGLDSDFWSAGFRWVPNENTSVEGSYGGRFFGDSWSMSIEHRARMLEFSAGYSEDPQVETRTLSLGDFDPGTLPPGLPPVDISFINSTPYIARNATAEVRAVGSRTTLSARAFQYERDYIQTNRSDDSNTGVGINATRQLASNLSADFGIDYSKYETTFDPLSAEEAVTSDNRDTTVTARLSRQSGERLTISIESGYLTRSGDQDFDGWWLGLRALWTP